MDSEETMSMPTAQENPVIRKGATAVAEQLPGSFKYEDFMSKPIVSENFSWSSERPVLTLDHLFGYDSKRSANLHVLGQEVVVYIAGNFITIFDTAQSRSAFLRSTGGGGISCLDVHPSRKYFASGESGNNPAVNIFEYPSCELYKVLLGGAKSFFYCMAFNPGPGDKLVTQGGDPDFLLTIWNWEKETPLQRCKSLAKDVYRIFFSHTQLDSLVSSGQGHIRFWKLSNTFTGLKLQYQTGKFGNVELSDIQCCHELPDGQVITGSNWGNLLLWEDGLVKAEFAREGKKGLLTCHKGKINHVFVDEITSKLYSLGADGYLRAWPCEDICYAEPEHQGAICFICPLFEFEVGCQADLLQMAKAESIQDSLNAFYLQDGSGKIWKGDVSSGVLIPIVQCHGGPVTACAASPVSHLIATAGNDTIVRIFDCVKRTEIASLSLPFPIVCLQWIPSWVDQFGTAIAVGLHDGSVAILHVCSSKKLSWTASTSGAGILSFTQVYKPHESAVTSLSFSGDGQLMATGSSEANVFLFTISKMHFEPLGFVTLPYTVRYLAWTPKEYSYRGLLVVCDTGYITEIFVPQLTDIGIGEDYQLTNLQQRHFIFSGLEAKLQRVKQELLKRVPPTETEFPCHELTEDKLEKIEEDGKETKQSTSRLLEHSIDLMDENKSATSDIQSPVLWAKYASLETTCILSVGGLCTGYLYKYRFASETGMANESGAPFVVIPIPNCDSALTCIEFNSDGHIACLGFENGQLRIVQLDIPYDLSDLSAYWHLGVHDNRNGCITGIAFAFDDSYLVSSGMDGNIFLFSFAGRLERLSDTQQRADMCTSTSHVMSESKFLAVSLRKGRMMDKQETLMKKAEESKSRQRQVIRSLFQQLVSVLNQNSRLPAHVQLSKEELLINQDLKEDFHCYLNKKVKAIEKESMWSAERNTIALNKMKNAFQFIDNKPIIVKAFLTSFEVSSYRIPKLHPFLKNTLSSQDSSDKPETSFESQQPQSSPERRLSKEDESAWELLTQNMKRMNLQGMDERRVKTIYQRLKKARKLRLARKKQWEELYKFKPSLDYEDLQEVSAIREASSTIGSFSFRTQVDIQKSEDVLLFNACEFLLKFVISEENICKHMKAFNLKLSMLQNERNVLIHYYHKMRDYFRAALQDDMTFEKIQSTINFFSREFQEKSFVCDEIFLKKYKNELQNRQSRDYSVEALEGAPYARARRLSNFERSHPYKIYIPNKSDLEREKEDSLRTAEMDRIDFMVSYAQEGTVELSPLQLEMNNIRKLQLEFEGKHVKTFLNSLFLKFNQKLHNLWKEKMKLDIHLKKAELRHITLLEEFFEQKATEHKEIDLLAMKKCELKELASLKVKQSELLEQSKRKAREVQSISDQLENLWNDFQWEINNQSLGLKRFLTKVFKKREYVGGEGGSGTSEGSETESDSEISSASSSDKEESEDEQFLDPTKCPASCDQSLFDIIIELQRKRQMLDNALSAAKKSLEGTYKDIETANASMTSHSRALERVNTELYTCLSKKVEAINSLVVAVFLHLDQIPKSSFEILVKNLHGTVLMGVLKLRQLSQRIPELKSEILVLRKDCGKAKQKYYHLHADRKSFYSRIASMEKRCNDEMIKKFGRVVDVSEMEKILINPRLEELKMQIDGNRVKHKAELRQYEARIRDWREKLENTRKDNTNLIIWKADMLKKFHSLEKSLDYPITSCTSMPVSDMQEPIRQKDSNTLRYLILKQRQEIQALLQEIEFLRGRKFSRFRFPGMVNTQ